MFFPLSTPKMPILSTKIASTDNSVVSFPAILSNGLGPTCALSLCYLGLSVGLIASDVVYTHRNYDKICEMKVFCKKNG